METGIHNTSEIGRLRKVLLHRPGQELENLMPEYLERLLFDDIPYLKEAQAEHDAFAQCLRDAGVEVVYLIDLVVNSLTSPEVRQELVTQFLKEADLPDEAVGKAVAEYLSELDDRAMVSAMMAGIRRSDLRKQGGRLSDHLSGLEEGYPFAVDPMPNLYFTRDPGACVGNGIKGAESLGWYRRLAELLGGKLACTRPVFDRGLLPFKLVIGQSGVVVKPRLYLCFGVSGAVNHVTGFADAGRKIAVNSDPDAAIFNYCDFGLVGDMDETCDLLIKQLSK